MTNATAPTASQSYGGKRKHGLGWVPWLAALLLAALVLGAVLLALNVNDNNDQSGVDLSDDEVAATAGAGTAGAMSSGGAAGSTAAMGAVRTSNGTDLLALATAGQLGTVQGQSATATDIAVTSVVANEGFWVGGNGQQLFVHLTQQARGTGESAVQVATGQRVDFSGTVTRAPSDVSTLGVTASEGAEQLRSEGSYIEATTFRIR